MFNRLACNRAVVSAEKDTDFIHRKSSFAVSSFICLLAYAGVPQANNADDALKDEQRLIAAGAKIVPGLARQRNPWGSLLTQPRPRMVRGFESYNRWIVGGFK
jgi:hypothetical protein